VRLLLWIVHVISIDGHAGQRDDLERGPWYAIAVRPAIQAVRDDERVNARARVRQCAALLDLWV
jgi:hypothetical protein